MYTHGDYTKEEVANAALVMEQFVSYHKGEVCYDELKIALHILRAINKLGLGTQWLSEMSNT